MVPMLVILPNEQGVLPKSRELAEKGLVISTAIANPPSKTCSTCRFSKECTSTSSTCPSKVAIALNGGAAQPA